MYNLALKIRAGEPQPEQGVFGSLEPEPLEKKNQEQEPESLGKKVRSPGNRGGR